MERQPGVLTLRVPGRRAPLGGSVASATMAEEKDQPTAADEEAPAEEEATAAGGPTDGADAPEGTVGDGSADAGPAEGQRAESAGAAGPATSKAGAADGSAPKKVVAKKKVVSKRVTPKGGATKGSTAAHAHAAQGHDAEGSKRYTPPTAKYQDLPSPAWVPVLMFGLLGFGALIIVLNYAEVFGEPANWRLLVGLASILGGIIAATNYR